MSCEDSGVATRGSLPECSVHLSEPEPMVFAEEPEARA
jgi:hypothetical protein